MKIKYLTGRLRGQTREIVATDRTTDTFTLRPTRWERFTGWLRSLRQR